MEPTEELLRGRRSLEGIHGYKLINDLEWNGKKRRWLLQFQLNMPFDYAETAGLVPSRTRWYALLDSTYPWGGITIYPDQEHGIVDTFQHQNCDQSSTEFPWRTGDLCVKTNLRGFARRGYDAEPYDSDTRLAWHVERCKVWLELANADQLSSNGDPFEIPHYPFKTDKIIAFLENKNSFLKWQEFQDKFGIVFLKKLNAQVLFIDGFKGFTKGASINIKWGNYLTDNYFKETVGIWLHLQEAPALPPWKAPLTWEELFSVGAIQGIDIENLIKHAYQKAWKYQPTLLLLGFPVPNNIGEPLQQIYWLAIELDSLPSVKGFRPNSLEFARHVITQLFRPQKQLKWASSENWDQTEISARGRLDSIITSQSILIIGAGAVGSVVAELLSRAGCYKLTLIDEDATEIGNMSRHTLTMQDLRTAKAEAVANRLNRVFPHNEIYYIKRTIQEELRNNKSFLEKYVTVIDATGSDEVLLTLSEARHSAFSKLVSLSAGMYARRFFCFTSILSNKTARVFQDKIKPWLIKEKLEYKDSELPREGMGCWHPLFPARADDVWMLTSASIKTLEEFILSDIKESKLSVFEQNYDKGKFTDVTLAADE